MNGQIDPIRTGSALEPGADVEVQSDVAALGGDTILQRPTETGVEGNMVINHRIEANAQAGEGGACIGRNVLDMSHIEEGEQVGCRDVLGILGRDIKMQFVAQDDSLVAAGFGGGIAPDPIVYKGTRLCSLPTQGY